jgi:DNA-binding NarL/FixJ family response regulator
MKTIKLALADDEELFRVGLSHILSRNEDIEVVLEASNGQELLDGIASCRETPDMVLMDLKMPQLNGVETTRAMRERYPKINIIALTTYNTKPFIRNMIEVGASAYLVKNSPPAKVLHTIRQVYQNGFHYDQKVIDAIRKKSGRSRNQTSGSSFDSDMLTSREHQILELICRQYTSYEIADELFISKRTVEVHRKNLLDKTGVKNIAGLVVFAVKHELVPDIIIE